jgi:hypothetical protein
VNEAPEPYFQKPFLNFIKISSIFDNAWPRFEPNTVERKQRSFDKAEALQKSLLPLTIYIHIDIVIFFNSACPKMYKITEGRRDFKCCGAHTKKII